MLLLSRQASFGRGALAQKLGNDIGWLAACVSAATNRALDDLVKDGMINCVKQF